MDTASKLNQLFSDPTEAFDSAIEVDLARLGPLPSERQLRSWGDSGSAPFKPDGFTFVQGLTWGHVRSFCEAERQMVQDARNYSRLLRVALLSAEIIFDNSTELHNYDDLLDVNIVYDRSVVPFVQEMNHRKASWRMFGNVGVISAIAALTSAGCVTADSCGEMLFEHVAFEGSGTGSCSRREFPYPDGCPWVSFYCREELVSVMIDACRATGCGILNTHDRLMVSGRGPVALIQLAENLVDKLEHPFVAG